MGFDAGSTLGGRAGVGADSRSGCGSVGGGGIASPWSGADVGCWNRCSGGGTRRVPSARVLLGLGSGDDDRRARALRPSPASAEQAARRRPARASPRRRSLGLGGRRGFRHLGALRDRTARLQVEDDARRIREQHLLHRDVARRERDANGRGRRRRPARRGPSSRRGSSRARRARCWRRRVRRSARVRRRCSATGAGSRPSSRARRRCGCARLRGYRRALPRPARRQRHLPRASSAAMAVHTIARTAAPVRVPPRDPIDLRSAAPWDGFPLPRARAAASATAGEPLLCRGRIGARRERGRTPVSAILLGRTGGLLECFLARDRAAPRTRPACPAAATGPGLGPQPAPIPVRSHQVGGRGGSKGTTCEDDPLGWSSERRAATAGRMRGPYHDTKVPSMQWMRASRAAGTSSRASSRGVARTERVGLVGQQDHVGRGRLDVVRARRSGSGDRRGRRTRWRRRRAPASSGCRYRGRPSSRGRARSGRRRATWRARPARLRRAPPPPRPAPTTAAIAAGVAPSAASSRSSVDALPHRARVGHPDDEARCAQLFDHAARVLLVVRDHEVRAPARRSPRRSRPWCRPPSAAPRRDRPGCTHQSVTPTTRSPSPSAKSASVRLGTSETIR